MTRGRARRLVLRRCVGMFVALSQGVMLLSELIIIYLAAAAPFGVAYFLRQPDGVTRSRSLLHATGAALLWPCALLSRALVHKKFRRTQQSTAAMPEVSSAHERRIDAARRALLSSLHRTGDFAEEVAGLKTEATREALRETLAAVERYVGLASAVADADEAASPPHATREMELCRLSGRTGDDLRIAGLCHGRRNIARLRAHGADARLELLHALAELREIFESTLAATSSDAQITATMRPLFAALLETYLRAVDLFSLFGDERAAARIARLLDAVRARLHWIESLNLQAPPQSLNEPDTAGNADGDEPCPTSIPPTNPQPPLSRPQTIRAHG